MAAPRVGVSLPRLLYVGDVPVEHTVAGAALLYRLFDGYPPDRLRICHSDLAAVRAPGRRLAGVTYDQYALGRTRLLHSRLAGYYGAYLLARAPSTAAALSSRLDWRPDAVVTVAHSFSWRIAARLAQRRRIPLHLIVHDECLKTMEVAPVMRGFAEGRFREAYRSAASRFCISPAMRDYYFERYGVGSEVLYPSRAKDARDWAVPPPRVTRRESPLTVAFAGSLSVGHVPLLESLERALAGLGGRLEIYGASLAPAVQARLSSPVTSFHPFMPADALTERLRERADVLVMPMSFEAGDAQNMALCFPAKLADYTAMGIPVLIIGPDYCSAVRWARENPGVAAIVTEPSSVEIARVLRPLVDDMGLRRSLAGEASRVGRAMFAHGEAQRRFFAGLAIAPVPGGAHL